MTTKSGPSKERIPTQAPSPGALPSEQRGSRLVLGVVVASVALHGLAFAGLSAVPPSAPSRPPAEERIALPPPKAKPRYQVRVVPRPAPRPSEKVTPPAPSPSVSPKLKAPTRRAPAPRVARVTRRAPTPTPTKAAPPAATPAAVIDLTQATAGVNPSLTAGSGPGGFNLGSTAVGDPNGPPGAKGQGRAPAARAATKVVASEAAPRVARSTPVVVKRMPEVVTVPKASYPSAAKDKRVEGTVRLLVTVDSKGRVTSVRVLQGLGHGLDEAAVSALKRARFRPALGSDDRPLSYAIRYRYTFRLEG